MAQPTVKRVQVIGFVQGVGFRHAAWVRARELGITGWVRNRSSGDVETVVAGSAAAVERMIEWLRRGPPAARVEHIEVSDAEGEFLSFEHWPTL